MLRTSLAKAHLKRTIRPNYGWTQSTPKSCYLDPAWNRSVDIYPGMVCSRTSGENYTLLGAAPMQPSGLAALYVGGDGIDEVEDQGVNAFAVWVLGPDAEFEVMAPAFDSALSWTDPGNGSDLLIHGQTTGATRGKLVPAGTSGASVLPVARLLKVVSATKIIIGGLRGTV